MRQMTSRTIVIAAVIGLAAIGTAAAQEASGYVQLTASQNDSETTDASGGRTERQTETLQQRYNLDLSWRLYPNLTLRAGGLFERNDARAEAGGVRSDLTAKNIRPFLRTLLQSDLFRSQLGYFRSRDDLETPAATTTTISDDYDAIFEWRPERLPRVAIRWLRTDRYDEPRRALDTTDSRADLTAEYRPHDSLEIFYRGFLGENRDRLRDTVIDRTGNSARLNYSEGWWENRVQLDAEYDFNSLRTEVVRSGSGDVETPLFPFAGLSAIDDTPNDEALPPNPLLIDGDFAVPAGINLGLPPPGGDDRPRNIGLDFGGPTTANTLFVWVDRDLTGEPVITGSYVWDIYSSPDNLLWTLEETILAAPFGPFQNRFELRFANITSRYLKVVVGPLTLAVPGSGTFPDILVTELTAVLTTPIADAELDSTRTTQILSANLRTRILDAPSLYYELTGFLRDVDSAASEYVISNGLSLRHAFSPQYAVTGRAAREDSRERQGDRVSYLYSAALRSTPLPTLQNSVVFSGRSTEIEGRASNDQSLFVYTSADLYSGITANLGLGLSDSKGEDGRISENTYVNSVVTLVPHPSTSFNLLYQDRRSKRRGGSLTAEQTDSLQSGQASVSYRPLSTIYFFFSYRVESLQDGSDRFLRNYAASWSPFPGGALQFLFRYDEAFRSEYDALSRIVSPRVRWNISNRWYWEVSYEQTRFDSSTELRTSDGWRSNMLLTF